MVFLLDQGGNLPLKNGLLGYNKKSKVIFWKKMSDINLIGSKLIRNIRVRTSMLPTKKIAKGHFEYIRSEILVFTLTKPQPTKADILEYEQAIIEMLESMPNQLVIVYDASATEWASSETISTFGQVVNHLDNRFKDQVVSNHIIVPNIMTKLILNGVNLIANPIIKQHVYNDRSTALSAANDQISEWSQLAY